MSTEIKINIDMTKFKNLLNEKEKIFEKQFCLEYIYEKLLSNVENIMLEKILSSIETSKEDAKEFKKILTEIRKAKETEKIEIENNNYIYSATFDTDKNFIEEHFIKIIKKQLSNKTIEDNILNHAQIKWIKNSTNNDFEILYHALENIEYIEKNELKI